MGSAIRMKLKINKLSQRYLAALRLHLRKGGVETLRAATGIGQRAVTLELEPPALANIHEKTLAVLKLAPTERRLNKRAQAFFAQVLIPIFQTRRFAGRHNGNVIRLNEKLCRRTTELTDRNRSLKKGIVRYKTMEATLKRNGKRYMELLKESLELQESLRQLARKGLTAQEAERKKISHDLQDDVAQLLLGINVRLLSLRRDARGNTRILKNEIASTQRLVSESVKSVREVVSELDRHRYL
jgi:signal transduction histidine kinase